uniref:DUF3700 domain-containing protein n=1 Tax=Cannabis sativa TaxID=3483 RepID=A0A803R8T0_CANSA
MLAIFDKELVHPPQELNSPNVDSRKAKFPQEILNHFSSSSDNDKAFSVGFGNSALMAFVTQEMSFSLHQRYI